MAMGFLSEILCFGAGNGLNWDFESAMGVEVALG